MSDLARIPNRLPLRFACPHGCDPSRSAASAGRAGFLTEHGLRMHLVAKHGLIGLRKRDPAEQRRKHAAYMRRWVAARKCGKLAS